MVVSDRRKLVSLQQSADHLNRVVGMNEYIHLCGEFAHDLSDDCSVLSAECLAVE